MYYICYTPKEAENCMDDLKIKLTIIIPVYNGEKHIKRCFDSIGKQESLQCVFVNDGSTDNSAQILDSLSKENPYVEVIHSSNGGVSNARNIGLNYAKGEWVTFLDVDDVLLHDWSLKIKDKLESDFDLICFSHIWEYLPGKTKTVYYTNLDAKRLVLTTAEMNPCWAKLYRRSIIESNKLKFDTSMKYGEDMCFVLDFCTMTSKIEICNEPLVFYKNNLGSAMHNGNIHVRMADNMKMLKKRLYAVEKENSKLIPMIYRHHFCALTDIMRSIALSGKHTFRAFCQINKEEFFHVVMENVDLTYFDKKKRMEFFILKKMYFISPVYFGIKAFVYKHI